MITNFTRPLFKKIFFSFLFFSSFVNFSQISEERIVDSYKSFAEVPKEIVYVHLNKSLFAKNEMLGFSAYTINKGNKKLSKLTSNLYCVIKDENNKTIKSKLVRVKNGLANNTFKIDSTFSSGIYSFKAYTNWMLNFDEKNYYEANFRVINNNIELNKESQKISYSIQVLPESGHIVENTFNSIGIAVKDNKGKGLPFAKGKIIDENNEIVSIFNCNEFGLAKTYLFPKKNIKYKVVIKNKPNLEKDINSIKPLGFNMSLKFQEDLLKLTFKTNKKSLQFLKNKEYFLVIHNGTEMKIKEFIFPDNTEFYDIIKKEILFSGINIFTVFDKDKNLPILERICFNKIGIKSSNIQHIRNSKEQDSTTIYLSLNQKINPSKINNLSISVLPTNTKSYNFESNILSQVYLEPYVKGNIENAKYYFNENTKSVDYNLDLLLLTQGWSSYDWGTIFSKPIIKHSFEKGIDIVANLNDKKDKEFITYPLKHNSSQLFKLSSKDKAFKQKGLFPYTDETFKISALNKRKEVSKPKLYVQFYPSKLPELENNNFNNIYFDNYKVKSDYSNNLDNFWKLNKETEVLDEIIIKSNKERRRRDSLQDKSFGRIDFFDDKKRSRGFTLAMYLNSRGYDARDDNGLLTIVDRRPNTFNNSTPMLILDDIILQDFSFLGRYTLDLVDYIMIDRTGQGYGIRGGAGVIKIKTDPNVILKNRAKKDQLQTYKFPVSFARPTKFFVPMYDSFNSSFFNEVGVIDWKPNVKVNSKGIIKFKISNNNLKSYLLFIEGVFNDGEFISQKIKVSNNSKIN